MHIHKPENIFCIFRHRCTQSFFVVLKKHVVCIAWCLFQFVVALLITYKCIHWQKANGNKTTSAQ